MIYVLLDERSTTGTRAIGRGCPRTTSRCQISPPTRRPAKDVRPPPCCAGRFQLGGPAAACAAAASASQHADLAQRPVSPLQLLLLLLLLLLLRALRVGPADVWKRSDHIKKWNKRWFVLWPSANRPGDGRVLFWFDKPVRCPETSLSPRLPTLTRFGRRAPLRCAGRQEGKGQRQAHPGLLQPTVPRRQGEGRPRLPAHRPHRGAEPRPGTRHAQRAAPFFGPRRSLWSESAAGFSVLMAGAGSTTAAGAPGH